MRMIKSYNFCFDWLEKYAILMFLSSHPALADTQVHRQYSHDVILQMLSFYLSIPNSSAKTFSPYRKSHIFIFLSNACMIEKTC